MNPYVQGVKCGKKIFCLGMLVFAIRVCPIYNGHTENEFFKGHLYKRHKNLIRTD